MTNYDPRSLWEYKVFKNQFILSQFILYFSIKNRREKFSSYRSVKALILIINKYFQLLKNIFDN